MPPSSNTGAEFSAPVENQILIDFLSFTLKTLNPHEAVEQAGLSGMDFSDTSIGGMGYKRSLRAGQVVIFYDGMENMGCHISMSGQGCRQFEGFCGHDAPWRDFLSRLLSSDDGIPLANITRLDLAIDNVDGVLDLSRVRSCIDNGEYRSKFKDVLEYRKRRLDHKKDALPCGESFYFGAKSSRILIRIYNKAAQLNLDSHWVRCELQCRAERASEAARYLASGMDCGFLAVSVLNNYLAFINLADSNISRCPLQKWWANFISITNKMRLTTAPSIRVVAHVVDYLRRQYAPSFAMLRKYFGIVRFNEFVSELIEDGKGRLSKKHDFILKMSGFSPATDYPF